MRKFLTRAKIHVLILGFIIVCLITIAGNVSLTVNKLPIEQKIDGYFKHNISIGSLFYVFPNFIILNDIGIHKKQTSPKTSSFVLSRVIMRFSFWKLLLNGQLNVSRVTVYSSKVSYYAISQFLEDNFQEILEIIRNSPGNDITIRVKESLLDFDRKGRPDYIAMEFILKIKDDVMDGTGYFRADQYDFSDSGNGEIQRIAQGWPLWYKLSSQLKPNGLQVDRLIFKSGNLHSKLWGSIRGGIVKINGFTFMNTAKKQFSEEEYSSTRYFSYFPETEELSNVDTYVLDIDGRIMLAYPDINIEKFNFTLNNIPITLNGKVSLQKPTLINADLSLFGKETSAEEETFFEKIDIGLSGTWKDEKLKINGTSDIDFAEREETNFPLQSAQIDLKELELYFDLQKRLNIDLADGDFGYRTKKNEHKIHIDHFKMAGDTKVEGLKLFEMNAPFYGGALDGKMWVDSSQRPSKITSRIVLTDVDTDAMEEFSIHFAKFNGRMTSEMDFTNTPQLSLLGDITILDGTMTDFAFFHWLGDSFRLPDLKAIPFDRASAQFSVDREHTQLSSIRLNTKDVRIGGYFDVDNKNLVSSKLSLSLSQDLLRKSSKFRPILKMFDEDDTHLGFDFQLSGNMGAMNFQWLPSKDKTKIQTRIPDFIERLIERDVDAMMDPKP